MITQKVKKQHIIESLRFDGSYHLSDGTLYLRKLRKMPHQELQSLCSDIFTAGRSKRIYTEKDKGFPYLSNSDVVKGNPLDGCKYNSKKYAFDEPSFLKEGMIVTGRVGAIGQTAYITSELEDNQAMGSDNIIRVVCKDKNISGYVYSFLVSKYGNTLLNRLAAGGVQPYISEDMLKDIPIPILSEEKQQKIHQLIVDASELRVEANKLLQETETFLKESLDLPKLEKDDYEYFGNHSVGREVSAFVRKSKEISSISINAFNYSKRIEKIVSTIQNKDYLSLDECLNEKKFFSTGSFRRLEVNSTNGIKLLNQSDIFDIHKKGKILSRHFVGNVKLVEYGEVLIAGVGTLGEGETFCRSIFANEELENQLISGEFIRMKTNEQIPSGYLFAWLNSDYGFRLIRSTQTGTKLCRPIPNLLAKIPVPLMDREQMNYIDKHVREAHTDFYKAIVKENQAIALIEKEIDLWQVS
ncbi:methylation-associated defense system restriction endonuclease subunit S MAD5 [Elizabethkingia anophelis]|uniref:methylation-associated defense system restriction endonuclease subunit S MAD5 n=1 Tax=Elizabethkingia anophelis TaxID=1117645 RepID=UPI002923C6C4|nr:MAG: hypothetical protein PQ275_25720 [Elizabethkingia anophelis]